MSIFRRLVVAAATVAVVLLFGASGAGAVPATTALSATGFVTAPGDESDEPTDEEDSDNPDDEDNSDDEDSDDENSDEDNSDEDNSDDPTDEPTDAPTFTEPPTTDTTDGITEMPTQDADATSEAGASPLGWILLAGGVACAAAAIAVYRRNRHIM